MIAKIKNLNCFKCDISGQKFDVNKKIVNRKHRRKECIRKQGMKTDNQRKERNKPKKVRKVKSEKDIKWKKQNEKWGQKKDLQK